MIEFRRLEGLTSYSEGQRIQRQLVDLRIQDRIPDTVLFLEHEPVVTRGRGLQGSAGLSRMPFDPGRLPAGIAFCETERGGDLTYHGPGQLVAYPIFKLGASAFSPTRDIGAFLRALELAVILELEALGLTAQSRPGASGVWVRRPSEPESELRKIASLGVAVRKWVTYHGIAINLTTTLSHFRFISPCGFSPDVMVRLSDLVVSPDEIFGRQPDWRGRFESALRQRFETWHRLGVEGARPGLRTEIAAAVAAASVDAGEVG